jgi:carbamoylphosphate synthase small subunit
MAMETPTATIRANLVSHLQEIFSSFKIYPEFPKLENVINPAIVIQHITGTTENVGHGKRLSSTLQGKTVVFVAQIDVYQSTGALRDEYADKVILGLEKNSFHLKQTHGIEVGEHTARDLDPEEPEAKHLYRKVIVVHLRIDASWTA